MELSFVPWRTTSEKVRTWTGESSMRESIANRLHSDNSFPSYRRPWHRGPMTATIDTTRVTLRDAAPADAAAICRIYNQGIEDRVATLETELRTPAERAAWLAERDPRHPVLVGEVDGSPISWGSLNRFNPRP